MARKGNKSAQIYMTDDAWSRLNYLIDYYNHPGAKAGITSVFQYALDRLYYQVVSEQAEQEQKEG